MKLEASHLTRGLLEQRIHVKLQLELRYVEVFYILLYGGTPFDPLAGFLIRIVVVAVLL